MFYRVVMQGRTLGGADVAAVKRDFVRVTGLPAKVAEDMFGGMPKVIKRQVAQSDAERIAATLRAIGAAAIVERELAGSEDKTPEGIRIVATPLNAGPPTVIPGMEPLAEQPAPKSKALRLLGALAHRWPLIAGAAAVVAAAVLLAPYADEWLTKMRRAPAPAAVAKASAAPAEAVLQAPALSPTLLQGPWRCVDQRTGVSTYWSYSPDGILIFHGDVLSDRPAPRTSSTPTLWKLDGRRLLHTFDQHAPETYAVTELTLTRLRYGNERGLDIACRRP
ncbi:MAG TPA: hypothetical protein VMN56_07235 [Casimicrobiaceae bacterium]|nr:hypothetical protein [Casimicrobiaceae bacterium]